VPVVVCVVRKLRPCLSYSRRRDCFNSVLLRSLDRGGGATSFFQDLFLLPWSEALLWLSWTVALPISPANPANAPSRPDTWHVVGCSLGGLQGLQGCYASGCRTATHCTKCMGRQQCVMGAYVSTPGAAPVLPVQLNKPRWGSKRPLPFSGTKQQARVKGLKPIPVPALCPPPEQPIVH
jgi:hypothetical protein